MGIEVEMEVEEALTAAAARASISHQRSTKPESSRARPGLPPAAPAALVASSRERVRAIICSIEEPFAMRGERRDKGGRGGRG